VRLRHRRQCGLHVDVGGRITTQVLIDQGEVVCVAAVAVGEGLLALHAAGARARVGGALG
jgi:ethanolamine utilization protein EutA